MPNLTNAWSSYLYIEYLWYLVIPALLSMPHKLFKSIPFIVLGLKDGYK